MRALAVSVLVAAVVFTPGRTRAVPASGALFSVSVPREMVTGEVVLTAVASDSAVRAVKWTVGDWSRVTPPPFHLSFDAGPVPFERRVLAVALDKDRRPLYRREAVLNPGGRGLRLEFLRPVDGQRARGPVEVELRAAASADDDVQSVSLEAGGAGVPLSPAGAGLFRGAVEVPAGPVGLVARLSTRRGREAERTLLLNAPGAVASVDVHVVEQLVGVSRLGRPVEGLSAADFEVREKRGRCEVRDARLLRDAPLAIGFAIDASVSLRDADALRRATADVFVESCFTSRDSAFVLTFGPVVTTLLGWSRSKTTLRETILSLEGYPVPGTALFAAVRRAVYLFQGSQGARALILVTDGYDFDGEVPEGAAIDYARQSGVRLFAIGLASQAADVTYVRRKGREGEPDVVEPVTTTVTQEPNRELLARLAAACGGRAFFVSDARELPRIYRAIERDLRTQYLVSWVSAAPRRGEFHPVEIRSAKGTVRTAAGFFY